MNNQESSNSITCFVFSWNTQTVAYTAKTADFINSLCEKIVASNTDLVVIGLQEDSIRGSTLINNDTSLLVQGLKDHYRLQELAELSGWGVTTYKALRDNWEYRPRGLRLAVFKRIQNTNIIIQSISVKMLICPSLRDWLTAGKGGVCINIVTNFGSLAFLNVHLPFSSRSIIKSNERHPALLWQAQCLEELYGECVKEYSPDHIIVLGDLNFRVQLRSEQASTIAKNLFTKDQKEYIKELLAEADELRLLINYPHSTLPKLLEGINNYGPTFLPTCKLAHNREPTNIAREGVYKCGKLDQRTPSWCDRILYTQNIECVEYDRWDYGNMNLSDHAAVLAKLVIKQGLGTNRTDNSI